MHELASTFKITYHKKKIESYLLNKPIFPATLELDITSQCNRNCQNCPSSRSHEHHYLELDFIERLFSSLQGQTKGLLLTGGEPTIAPSFPQVVQMAKKFGFKEIAVVTNGSLLGEKRVYNALIEHVSTIRVSMHDWTEKSDEALHETFKRIEALRLRIDKENSNLQIGISALTSKIKADQLKKVADKVQDAGAHWIYFHPLCIKWDIGSPVQVNQKDVLKKIVECQKSMRNGFNVFYLHERYFNSALDFNEYHSAHFLLTIGADKMNYLGAEVKYQPQHIIADLSGKWHDDFLWQKDRRRRIKAVSSNTYPAIGSRHRGMLFSHLIEEFKQNRNMLSEESSKIKKDEFMFPHIL
jgi:MoaA/NifB/PqqE/SkfB family radical SAM enzyme